MKVSQAAFTAAMMDPAAARPPGVRDQNDAPAGRRFDVYRNNVAVSLTDALATGFPVVAKLLGDVNFKNISGVYLRQSPPQNPLMMHYGQDFPAFLRSFPPLAKLAYLSDVAELELALRRSYHAADADPIAADALANVAPELLPNVRMRFAPSMQLLQSPWPLYDLWAFNTFEGHPKPQAIAQAVGIFRAEFDPVPHALGPGAFDFITAMQAKATLGEAAEKATTTAQDFDLSACLGLLLGQGAITSIEHEEQP